MNPPFVDIVDRVYEGFKTWYFYVNIKYDNIQMVLCIELTCLGVLYI